jgi:hypothetical protein
MEKRCALLLLKTSAYVTTLESLHIRDLSLIERVTA